MEAVLVRASTATTTLGAGGYNGVKVKAVLAERSANIRVSQVATAEALRGLNIASSSQRSSAESIPGPLRSLWNGEVEPFRIPEEPLQEDYAGFVNYETLDGSIAEIESSDTCRVSHTRESFAKFLRHFPATELKDVAQACYLSNLAYIISEIDADGLEKDHRLRLVTSSIQQEGLEKSSGSAGSEFSKTLSPATAYALAATASYLQQSRSNSPKSSSPSSEALSRAVDHQLTSAVSSFMAESTPETTTSWCCRMPNAASTATGDIMDSASTSNSSPCGWFVCDEHTTATRIFSIQGSESMASWKANLRFQPTQFEDARSGAMVHKGVYEIAKSLYEQMLPWVRSHMAAYGRRARISFTGHSLGGSLAVLLSLLFRYRGEVPVSALRPVYTFGAPSVMHGGNRLLKRLGFPACHVQSVVISRDLVPRIFACDIPEKIVEVLKRVNENFRNMPSFVNQRQLYSTTGQLVILQPEAQQAPGHPLLPSGSGLYVLNRPATESQDHRESFAKARAKVRAAEWSFLNSPHPLEIMSDPSAYGSDGAICRDHDPRSYRRAVNHVLKQAVQGLQRRKKMDQLSHLKDQERKSTQFPNADVWPPSPVDTSRRSRRMADANAMSFFARASSAAVASGVSCNYLGQGLRKSLNTVVAPAGQPRFCASARCTSHVSGSHSQGSG